MPSYIIFLFYLLIFVSLHGIDIEVAHDGSSHCFRIIGAQISCPCSVLLLLSHVSPSV